MTDAKKMIDSYINWIRNNIIIDKSNDYIEITTPFLDRFNDSIQLYMIKQNEGQFLLTDDGKTISDLILSGIEITKKRNELINNILSRYAMGLNANNEIIALCNNDNFPIKKHFMIQAIISVNDLFMTSRSNVTSIFLEEVQSYLDKNDIYYSPNISFVGKSKFTQNFDFLIPPSKNNSEKILKAINKPSKDTTTSVLFAWDDVKNMRPKNSKLYVFLNDYKKNINNEIIDAFKEYDITSIPWSHRNEYRHELSIA